RNFDDPTISFLFNIFINEPFSLLILPPIIIAGLLEIGVVGTTFYMGPEDRDV
ncbi:unnamed protein product, partial [Ilex paraguariensis]